MCLDVEPTFINETVKSRALLGRSRRKRFISSVRVFGMWYRWCPEIALLFIRNTHFQRMYTVHHEDVTLGFIMYAQLAAKVMPNATDSCSANASYGTQDGGQRTDTRKKNPNSNTNRRIAKTRRIRIDHVDGIVNDISCNQRRPIKRDSQKWTIKCPPLIVTKQT